MFKPRPAQKTILEYQNGTMGISAVPGSGKTYTLSYLAAQLVATAELDEDQEVLIVTFANSAVDNFRHRIGSFVLEMGLLPNVGYRVRTLHGLAHDIVRERPGLVGLSDDFQIMDEREANRIRDRAVDAWLRANLEALLPDYMPQDVLENESKAKWVRENKWPFKAKTIARTVISQAKNLQLSPEDLRALLAGVPPLSLLEMAADIYADYQRALNYHGAVDFSDLIRLAIRALMMDSGYLERLQARWPFILEDEAQDSSHLQEEILRMLVGENGNWVRVGDPNQAIYETFTTASPELLKRFMLETDYPRELPNSGRSTQSIIDLANYLITWTKEEHDVEALRESLVEPLILPAPPDDPQPNPPDNLTHIHFLEDELSYEQEIQFVVDDLSLWLPDNTDQTVAVLVPTNEMGADVGAKLRQNKIDYIDILRSSSETRRTTGAITHVLMYLANPRDPKKLAKLYQVWRRDEIEDEVEGHKIRTTSSLLKKIERTEDYLWPIPGEDSFAVLEFSESNSETHRYLNEFMQYVRRWTRAVTLPIDQLVLTIGQDLFQQQSELALTHKLATLLKQVNTVRPEWRLPELIEELKVIARNRRNFIGFSDEDIRFDPDNIKGKVVITTMHKAKGLEWDRVYLMGVNNYHFPSAHPEDPYFAEEFYIRDRLHLPQEALAQLDAVLFRDQYDWYTEGRASEQARLDMASERLRLFYVCITRAKKNIIVTYNTYKNNHASVPFVALKTYSENKGNASS